MEKISSIKSSSNTPKTPGGISKSLLTPCRRVGLSRNWKKSNVSPFISPISGNNVQSSNTKEVERNSERRQLDQIVDTKPCEQELDKDISESEDGEVSVTKSTPLRTVSSGNKNKFKPPRKVLCSDEQDNIKENSVNTDSKIIEDVVVTDMDKINVKDNDVEKQPILEECVDSKQVIEVTKPSRKISKKKVQKSPNNLTKECIVLIQRKINKHAIQKDIKITDHNSKSNKADLKLKASQALFDSDSDDTPLSSLNKDNSVNMKQEKKRQLNELHDDDFCDDNKKSKVLKLTKKTSSKSEKKQNVQTKNNQDIKVIKEPKRDYLIDEDDDDFDTKKTILIRKSYDKVVKPHKSKSTGSISQRDIDEIKARIESKKNLLLVNSMTEDTAELRDLIKKWTKGCQNALLELMELVKHKCPEKQNMDYPEILKMLNIPSSLVGYNSETEEFCSPDDASIVLS